MDADGRKRAALVLDFVRERGDVHPRQVDDHFAHGTVTNYWGGSSSATTHLLEHMHYRGMLRVSAAREGHPHLRGPRDSPSLPDITLTPRERVDALDRRRSSTSTRRCPASPVVPREPAAVRRPAVAAGAEAGAGTRARQRLAHARVDDVEWYWPADEDPRMPRRTTRCACWRRSIRSCGTAGASSCSGAGRIASRRIRRWRTTARLLRPAAALARPRVGWGNLSRRRWRPDATSATLTRSRLASEHSSEAWTRRLKASDRSFVCSVDL